MLARNPLERTVAPFGMTSVGDAIASIKQHTSKKSARVFGENEPAEYIYQVRAGAVRSHKLLSDGRRQIGAFHLVGDIFGLENGDQHRYTAEAIVDTTVRLMRRSSLEQRAKDNPAIVADLLKMTTTNLQHAEDHMLLLGRKCALEKTAAFLVEMDKRMTATASVTLPMGRRDVADYLGLTLESVSRALTKLRVAGVLKFVGTTQREIVIVDRQRLATFDS
jgi:CRP/FNR family nitrogen fixation transcriptional regulator